LTDSIPRRTPEPVIKAILVFIIYVKLLSFN
jgi:hypothetical protein